jgi:hypothetical protein
MPRLRVWSVSDGREGAALEDNPFVIATVVGSSTDLLSLTGRAKGQAIERSRHLVLR